ncbi:protein serine/threonine kinase [Pelomyxa schiedti]|nr:protein serine/threonine kinase [Pelomyxa schiedti]
MSSVCSCGAVLAGSYKFCTACGQAKKPPKTSITSVTSTTPTPPLSSRPRNDSGGPPPAPAPPPRLLKPAEKRAIPTLPTSTVSITTSTTASSGRCTSPASPALASPHSPKPFIVHTETASVSSPTPPHSLSAAHNASQSDLKRNRVSAAVSSHKDSNKDPNGFGWIVNPSEMCPVCNKEVSPSDEKVVIGGKEHHRACWKTRDSPESTPSPEAHPKFGKPSSIRPRSMNCNALANGGSGTGLSGSNECIKLKPVKALPSAPQPHVQPTATSTPTPTPAPTPAPPIPTPTPSTPITAPQTSSPPPVLSTSAAEPKAKGGLGLGKLTSFIQGKDPTYEEKDKLKEKSFKKALLSPESITLQSVLGEGANGIVHKATYKDGVVAVKMLKYVEYFTQEQRDEFIREVSLLKQIKDAHIVKFVGMVITEDKLWLVTEFVGGGTLKSALQREPLALKVKVKIALDAAMGIEALHAHKIIHRDVKSDNLLVASLSVDTPTTVKLTDFGTSRVMKSNNQKAYTKGIGTPIYMAPELIQNQKYNKAADVFSFGILLWEILAQKEPYIEFESPWAVASFVVAGSRLPIPTGTPPDLQAIVDACWAQDPATRPTMSKVAAMLQACLKSLR